MNRARAALFIFLLVAFPIIIHYIHPPHLSGIKMATVSMLKLPLSAVAAVKSITKRIVDLPFLSRKNRDLEARLNELLLKNRELEEAAIENARLCRLLDFSERRTQRPVPARVIAKDPAGWSKSIIIDKGASDGIGIDSPVVTADGLAGRIIETGKRTSKVLLIIDTNSRISSVIQRTREEGIVEGRRDNLCNMKYISKDADIAIDDIVMTSGTGGIYPKGLIIGRVVEVGQDRSGLYKYALVRPAVSFSRIEEVLCIE